MERITIGKLRAQLECEYDVFLCAANAGERCLTIPMRFTRKMFGQVFVFHSAEGGPGATANLEELCKKYPKAERFCFDLEAPLKMLDELCALIGKNFPRTRPRVLLDMTGFPQELLLILLRALRKRRSAAKVTCLYAEPVECPADWRSKGCGPVGTVPGYSGTLYPARFERVLLLDGEEPERTDGILRQLAPHAVTVIPGRNEDPEQTAQLLEQAFAANPEENVIVAPMGDPLSTLGAAIFARRNAAIRICCAPAVVRNEELPDAPGKYCRICSFNKEK